MSVIAWDGKTLAADRRGVVQNQPIEYRKVHKLDAFTLVGYVGVASLGEQMLDWIRKGCEPSDFPPQQRVDETSWPVIVIRRWANEPDAREVSIYERTPFPFRRLEPFVALGCGRDLALGAMAMGATARQAVEIASRFDVFCGGCVDEIGFEQDSGQFIDDPCGYSESVRRREADYFRSRTIH